MTKYGRRETLNFASESLEKVEQSEGTKMETEDKVTKILKLVKNKDQDRKGLDTEELVELIEDFHKQYQSLYILYDHLRGEVKGKVDGKKGKDSSSSSSSSDSEYYSPIGSSGKSKSEHQKMTDNMKELETASLEVTDLKHKLVSTSEEKEALDLEYKAALSKKQESEKIISDLRVEAERRKNIIQKLRDESKQLKEKMGEREKNVLSSASTQITELEEQVGSLKLEMESLCAQKRQLEERLQSKITEIKQQGEKNLGLQTRISELEMLSKERGDELFAVMKKMEANESDSMSKFVDLTAQVNNLQQEVDSLRTQKGELEEKMASKSNEASSQIKGLTDQVDAMRQELELLNSQKAESESEVQRKTQKNLKNAIEIETLKEELQKWKATEEKFLEEKDGLRVKVINLELELDSVRNQKSELGEQIRTKSHETVQLRGEIDGLQDRISDMEKKLTERDDEFSALQRKLEEGENEASAKQVALTKEVNNLQHENGSLLTQKSQLEEKLTERGNEYSALQKKLEDGENEASAQRIALTTQINNLQQEKAQLELLIEKNKQEFSETITQSENQNMELRNVIGEQQRSLNQQGETIEKLNKENGEIKVSFKESKVKLQTAERKMEELAEEFCKNIEDKIRLLCQRIRVAEQLHAENKEYFKMSEQEHKMFKEKINEYSQIIAKNEAELMKMKVTSDRANNVFTGLDLVVSKFIQENGEFLNRISKLTNEVQRVKNLVKLNKEEREKLRGNVLNLEGEKLDLLKTVTQLEKMVVEKDEEKREAIRQLCVWIDYHSNRCDQLKKLVPKTAIRSQ